MNSECMPKKKQTSTQQDPRTYRYIKKFVGFLYDDGWNAPIRMCSVNEFLLCYCYLLWFFYDAEIVYVVHNIHILRQHWMLPTHGTTILCCWCCNLTE